MNKITSVNGTLVASLDELNEHVEDETAHVTEQERTAWNAQTTVKAKGILIATQEDLDGHAGNKAIHLTEEEREEWNGKQNKLTDEAGNITLTGGLTTAGIINANGGVNIPVVPPTPTHAARLVDGQRAMLMGASYYRPTKDLVSERLGTMVDGLQGLRFIAPGSPVRGISAVSINTGTTPWAQTKPAIIKITLTQHHWGSTMICAANTLDIIDSTDGPLLSSGAIAQLSINETDANDAYTIYDATGSSAVQGTLPRTLKGHAAVVDYYILSYRDRIYFYQGATWTNRESQLSGTSTDMPVYLGYAPRGNMYGMLCLVIAKGTNAHMWGQNPAGHLQSITEFRLPDASVFFPHLND